MIANGAQVIICTPAHFHRMLKDRCCFEASHMVPSCLMPVKTETHADINFKYVYLNSISEGK